MRRPRRLRERPRHGGPLVVDASVAVKWFAPEPESEAVATLLEQEISLVAPDTLPVEVANAWCKKARRGEMTRADVEESLVSLAAIGIELAPSAQLLGRAARLALDIQHPVYDCLYLVLGAERGARLATMDGALRRAATALGLRLWAPSRRR